MNANVHHKAASAYFSSNQTSQIGMDCKRELRLVSFTLIIDDLVLPSGTTCMEQLGGGGRSI